MMSQFFLAFGIAMIPHVLCAADPQVSYDGSCDGKHLKELIRYTERSLGKAFLGSEILADQFASDNPMGQGAPPGMHPVAGLFSAFIGGKGEIRQIPGEISEGFTYQVRLLAIPSPLDGVLHHVDGGRLTPGRALAVIHETAGFMASGNLPKDLESPDQTVRFSEGMTVREGMNAIALAIHRPWEITVVRNTWGPPGVDDEKDVVYPHMWLSFGDRFPDEGR